MCLRHFVTEFIFLRVRFWSDSLELLQPSIDAVQFIGVGVAWVSAPSDHATFSCSQLISSNCQLLSSSCQLLSMCQIGYNVEAYDMIYWACELLQIDVMHACMHACTWMLHESYCPRYMYLGFHVFVNCFPAKECITFWSLWKRKN